jgi:hypothetical protein
VATTLGAMVRRPVRCLAMMARWVKPFSVSRRLAAYFFRLASTLVLRLALPAGVAR